MLLVVLVVAMALAEDELDCELFATAVCKRESGRGNSFIIVWF